MSVPKATVNKNYFSSAGEDEIRCARHGATMQAIPVAHRMDELANRHLGTRVLGADARHSLAAFLPREGVRHMSFRCGNRSRTGDSEAFGEAEQLARSLLRYCGQRRWSKEVEAAEGERG